MTPSRDREQHGERFRLLFEHSSDAHLIFDETGITDCNDATIKLLRATDKAHVLSLHPAVLSPECQPEGRPSLEKATESGKRPAAVPTGRRSIGSPTTSARAYRSAGRSTR